MLKLSGVKIVMHIISSMVCFYDIKWIFESYQFIFTLLKKFINILNFSI